MCVVVIGGWHESGKCTLKPLLVQFCLCPFLICIITFKDSFIQITECMPLNDRDSHPYKTFANVFARVIAGCHERGKCTLKCYSSAIFTQL